MKTSVHDYKRGRFLRRIHEKKILCVLIIPECICFSFNLSEVFNDNNIVNDI